MESVVDTSNLEFLLQEHSVLLEGIEEQLIENNLLLENINNGISVLACFIVVVILFVLLHYGYKLLDMFFS